MAAPAGQPSCLEHEFLNWKDDIRLELLATGANEYSSTPAIEILHERSPRFGNTNDLMTFVQEQPGQDEYIQGLIASSIVVGVLFLAWAGLIVFLASTRHSLFSGNSLKISTPPKPPVYPSYQAANQVEDEKEKQEEASHRTEAKPTSKKRKYRSKKHTYDKHDPTKEKKYNKDPTLDKNLTQDQVKDFTKQYRTYKHAYDDWETHSQIARRQLKIMRIVVILGCCIIIASSLLFSIKGFDYLVGSVDSGNTLLSEGTELTQRGIDSVDFYLFKRAQTSASRNQLLGQLNGYCPKIKPQLCEHIESATNCNYEGMPFAVQIENVIDYIGVLPESLLADILAFRNDLIDFLVLLQNWKESLDQFHWALYVAIAFALTLSLLSLYLLIGVIWSWRNSSQNKPLHPAFTCLRSSVVMPLFILLVFLSWTFSTVFMIGSIALSDFCFDSPSDIIMALIYRLEAQGREVSSIVLHFIPYFASGTYKTKQICGPGLIFEQSILIFLLAIVRLTWFSCFSTRVFYK